MTWGIAGGGPAARLHGMPPPLPGLLTGSSPEFLPDPVRGSTWTLRAILDQPFPQLASESYNISISDHQISPKLFHITWWNFDI